MTSREHQLPSELLAAVRRGSTPEATIRDAVDFLLQDVAVEAPPAPLIPLARRRGVLKVEPVPMREAGRLVPIAGGYLIQVNEADGAGRQRFSIAHEICHTFFNEARKDQAEHSDITVGVFDEGNSEEFLCDVGAAHMLLHPSWILPIVGDELPELDHLFAVRSATEASLEATARQLVRLDGWEHTAFVFWEPGFRKSELRLLSQGSLPGMEEIAPRPVAKLRVRRVYPGPTAPFIPLNKSVDEDSPVAAALRQERRTRGSDDLGVHRGDSRGNYESEYVPFFAREGALRPRVVTLFRWTSGSAAA